jgi:hypothetical protein
MSSSSAAAVDGGAESRKPPFRLLSVFPRTDSCPHRARDAYCGFVPLLCFLLAAERRRRRSEAVAWLRALLAGSGLPLPPPGASDDELRAAFADGALLLAALSKVSSWPGTTPAEVRRRSPYVYTAASSGSGQFCLNSSSLARQGAAAGSDVGWFVAAVERMGLPSFAASDLDAVRVQRN